MTTAFRKGHGTGNDFVLLPHGSPDPSPSQVRALTDRHTGIGGDGVLRVARTADLDPSVAGEAEWFMDYRNADGSLAEMCGNGARLFARHLVEEGLAAGTFSFATRGGIRLATVHDDGVVAVTMGKAELSRLRVMPLVELGAQSWSAVAVFVPNPHAVAVVASLDLLPSTLPEPVIVASSVFPDGANVELVELLGPGRLRMRVHERGVGETLSCGTGAVAAAVVGAAQQHITGPFTFRVDVLGGTLQVGRDESGELTLTGPTAWAAEGTTGLL